MPTSYSNIKNDNYTTADTFPNRAVLKTGTISTNGIFVKGVGTLFLSEIGGDGGVGQPTKVAGGYIFNSTNEVRMIASVVSNTELVLDKAFTVGLAGAALYVAPDSRSMRGSYICPLGGGIVDGVTLAINESADFGYTASTPNEILNSIVINGSGGAVHTTIFQAN